MKRLFLSLLTAALFFGVTYTDQSQESAVVIVQPDDEEHPKY